MPAQVSKTGGVCVSCLGNHGSNVSMTAIIHRNLLEKGTWNWSVVEKLEEHWSELSNLGSKMKWCWEKKVWLWCKMINHLSATVTVTGIVSDHSTDRDAMKQWTQQMSHPSVVNICQEKRCCFCFCRSMSHSPQAVSAGRNPGFFILESRGWRLKENGETKWKQTPLHAVTNSLQKSHHVWVMSPAHQLSFNRWEAEKAKKHFEFVDQLSTQAKQRKCIINNWRKVSPHAQTAHCPKLTHRHACL